MASDPLRVDVFRATLGQGGADRVTITLLQELDRRRFSLRLILLRREGQLLPQVPVDVPVVVLDVGAVRQAAEPLRRTLATDPPAVLFSTSSGGNLAAARAVMGETRPRLVLSERNTLHRERWRPKRIVMRGLKRRLYKVAECVTAVSEGVRGDLIAMLGLPAHRIRTVLNPVVTEGLLTAARRPAHHPWLDGPGPPVVVAAGRLVHAKGFDLLLRAFADLRRRAPCRLVILGDGPLRSDLQRLAHKLGIGESVELHPFVANPFPLFASATVFVLPSRYEGLPNVLIQAMACGTAVVASDCPHGPREIVTGGEDGVLVPVGDVRMLTTAIASLLGDEGLRQRLAVAGRESSQRFSVERILPRYERALAAEPETGV